MIEKFNKRRMRIGIILLVLVISIGTVSAYSISKSSGDIKVDMAKESVKLYSQKNADKLKDTVKSIDTAIKKVDKEKKEEQAKKEEKERQDAKDKEQKEKDIKAAAEQASKNSDSYENSNTYSNQVQNPVAKNDEKPGFKGQAFSDCSQVITVTNSSKGSKYATVNCYEKSNNEWKLVYSDMSSIIGENGMQYDAYRKQDTNTTPAGIYNIVYTFGWGGNPGTKYSFRTPTDNSYWNLNNGSATYNRWVEGNPGGDNEKLKTERLYKYAIVLDYNWSQTPKKGGAIFMHLNPNYYTGGCVGLDESNLVSVMRWVDPSKNPKVLICPRGDFSQYYY